MKERASNSVRTRDDSEWRARASNARARRRAKGLPDLPLDWDVIIAKEAERRKEEILVAAFWQQLIEQRKALQIQIVKSGLQLMALGRKLEEALPIVGYRRQQVRKQGQKDDIIHQLKIPLPELTGPVEIEIRRVESGVFSLTIQAPVEVKVNLTGERYQDFRKESIDDVTTDYPRLLPDRYNISVVWEDRIWEIPLEVEET